MKITKTQPGTETAPAAHSAHSASAASAAPGRTGEFLPVSAGESIEDIALRYTDRGMDLLRFFLPEHFYGRAARRLLEAGSGTVMIATGFYVAGVCETDGPPGAFCLAYTLKNLGFRPVIVTDEPFREVLAGQDIPAIFVPVHAEDFCWKQLLSTYRPAALISVERCGKNRYGEYANMRGIPISEHTAPADRLFELAAERGIYTVGIGDGGNEIGMGNLREQIRERLSLEPSVIRTEDLLVATTSNWGAYALCAALVSRENRQAVLPPYGKLAAFIQTMADRGCVDGISGTARNWVDGFPPEKEEEIYTALLAAEDQD